MNEKSERKVDVMRSERNGLYWPTNVTSVDAGYAYLMRRVTDIDVALEFCHKKSIAVQAGGNVGLWPLRLAKFFSAVYTFEPVPELFEALMLNVCDNSSVIAHNALLSSAQDKDIPFSTRAGGVSRVVPAAEANSSFKSVTIDSLELPCCDAIFLDVEGHELEALEGAINTITNYRPVVTVEVWPENFERYREWFAEINYSMGRKVHGDYIFIPRG